MGGELSRDAILIAASCARAELSSGDFSYTAYKLS